MLTYITFFFKLRSCNTSEYNTLRPVSHPLDLAVGYYFDCADVHESILFVDALDILCQALLNITGTTKHINIEIKAN